MNKIKKELNKRKGSPYSWIRGLNIVKMLVLHNLIYRFDTIPIKIAASYFVAIDKLILTVIWKGKRPRIANTILKDSSQKTDTIQLFKTYYKAMVIIAFASGVLAKEETDRSMGNRAI